MATGKVSGVIGIVPGPSEGSRGSTGWGHLSRRAPWAEVGREPALSGLGRPPWASPLRLGLETLGWGAPHLTWGLSYPPGRRPPPLQMGSRPAPPSQGAYIKGGREGSSNYSLGRLPPPCYTSPSRRSSAKPCRDPLRPSPRRRAAGSPSTSPPPCWIKKEETSLHRTCVERGGAVRSALGHR